MRSQANRNYKSNDDINTPFELAYVLVRYFNPTGVILEPCKGKGSFLKWFPKNSPWCEIKEGKDFMEWRESRLDYN